MTSGTIFDIRRFSTHDGEGIRTTIFMKGCPLSCLWCHNPEGISVKSHPIYFPNKCIRCQICCRLAKSGGIRMTKEGIKLLSDSHENWDEIISECPSNALVWDSRSRTVEETVAEVMRDAPFFKYKGGITLSGGEPFLQHQFAIELLKEFKKAGIHTAIETSLYVKKEILVEALSYTDFIYADCKIWDSNIHKRLTGVPNELIKENIKYLLESDKKASVVIRTPMIPELTATVENIGAISRYLSGIYEHVSYEILNYNPLAESKYHLINQDFYSKNHPVAYSREAMLEFGRVATSNGVKQIIIES